jgi:hypothetical protein
LDFVAYRALDFPYGAGDVSLDLNHKKPPNSRHGVAAARI